MADYSGEQHGLPTVSGVEPNWHGRWEFSLNKTSATTYSWSLKAFISLSPGKKAKCDRDNGADGLTPYLDVNISNTDQHKTSYGPYGPVIGGNGWYQFRDTLSGSFSVQGSKVIDVRVALYTGLGSSMGTGLMAIDTWYFSAGQYAVQGITAAVPSNPRCTGKTSSSISMAFDVDWGGDDGTRDPASILYDSGGNQIAVIRNGTTSATFTGLSRYTPYYIGGYACNSVGGGYTNKVLVYTDPENPTLNAPVVSNSKVSSGIQGVASIDVTPGVVTDNGGKAITQVETYIRGGQYGSTLTSIGTGTSKKTVNNLLPNTEYYVITRATNGITEAYSGYTSFTTLGNPPEFTDIYASNLALTSSSINYSAKYEYNARFKEYQVEWRYPGTGTWTKLSKSTNRITGTNFDSRDDNKIEYRVTVTDNWNRSTTSNVLNYRVIFDYTNDITNFKAVRNADDTFTITGNWTKRLYTKISTCLILSHQSQQNMELAGNFSNLTMTQSGFTFKTKQYKNKYIQLSFCLFLSIKSSNTLIYKYLDIKELNYPNAINTINKSGNVVSRQFSSIGYNNEGKVEVKRLRQHDIVKLSKTMRYIDIDSRGTSSNISISRSNVGTLGRFTFDYSYLITHISKTLYRLELTKFRIKTSDNSTIRIRNNNLLITFNRTDPVSYKLAFTIPNMTVNSSYQEIDISNYHSYFLQNDNNSTTVKGNLFIYWWSEFDYQQSPGLQSDFSQTKNYGNSDISNNHLVNIKVYDKDNIDRAAGKSIKLIDGTNPVVYNGGNPTNGTLDSNKFIYSENGLPLRLDLGHEYEVKRIEIQRRILTNNTYSRNYIIGRNNDKELCYIFYDSNAQNEYKEVNKTFNIK